GRGPPARPPCALDAARLPERSRGGEAMTARPVCVDGVELLMDYLEDVIGPEDRKVIEAHVSSCPRCTAFVESYRHTPRIFPAAPTAPPPGALAASLRRSLASRR